MRSVEKKDFNQLRYPIDSAVIMTFRHLLKNNEFHNVDITKITQWLFDKIPFYNVGQNRKLQSYRYLQEFSRAMLVRLLKNKEYDLILLSCAIGLPSNILSELMLEKRKITGDLFFKILYFYLLIFYDSDGFYQNDRFDPDI